MNLEDIQVGMTVRVGPLPSTDAEPFHYDPDGNYSSDRYVDPSWANQVATVTRLTDERLYNGRTVELEREGGEDQEIHPAHLEPYTAEADAATVASFDEIIGGAELDDLRDLGNTMDTATDEAAPNHEEDPADGIPVTDTPTPGVASTYPQKHGDHAGYTDPYGDTIEWLFREQNCPNHGYEAAFYVAVGDTTIVINPATALQMAQYIAERIQRIKSRGEDVE